MTETAWTPGPWAITPDSANGAEEAYCHWHTIGPVELAGDQPDANSYLIAAAPDLYEALRDILAADDSGEQWGAAAVHARAVLARARGETL